MVARKSVRPTRARQQIGRTSSRRLRSASGIGSVAGGEGSELSLEEEGGGEDGEEDGEYEGQEEDEVEDGSEASDRQEKKFSCPFSQDREGATNLCRWTAHADKRSLQTHLQKIRLMPIIESNQKSETGYDSYHPPNDPLWQSEKVKHLLFGRPKVDATARKELRKRYQNNYYQKRRDKRLELKALLEAGEISKAEFDQRVEDSKINLGWYRTKRELEDLADEFAAFRERMRLAYVHDSEDVNPVAYEWPTVPSVESYLRIVCLCLPAGLLAATKDPSTRDLQIKLKTALSTDKDYLDDWIQTTNRASLAAVFNSSCDLLNIRLNSMDRGDKKRFLNEWEVLKNGHLLSLTGNSLNVPTCALLDLVHDAFSLGR